jgi:hypothetical protein
MRRSSTGIRSMLALCFSAGAASPRGGGSAVAIEAWRGASRRRRSAEAEKPRESRGKCDLGGRLECGLSLPVAAESDPIPRRGS